MIKGKLTHPDMLRALAAAGHGSTVLITDGHYPVSTAVGPNTSIVYLNLEAGSPTVPDVLKVVLESIIVEKLTRIIPSPDAMPCLVHEEIDALIPKDIDTDFVERFSFYELARSADLALCVVTGDSRRFGNTLITIGVLRPA